MINETDTHYRGPLAWMAQNKIAANLMMIFFLIGGVLFVLKVRQEVFPEVSLDIVTISVAYPGASPVDVEEGIILAVEEAVRGVDGVEEIRAVAREGVAEITAELFTGANRDQALNDIKSAVDRITSFPQDAERPVISVPTNRREVLSLIVFGEVDRKTLKQVSEKVRAELLLDERITEVEISGLPPPEISVEIPLANLRRHHLTLEQIGAAIREASVDLPAGGIKTAKGEILLRISERRDYGDELREVAVISRADGVRRTLGELGAVIDTFRDTDEEAYFNGERAARIRVFQIGEQTPLDISQAVYDYLAKHRDQFGTLRFAVWNDRSEIFRDRISLLLKNGLMGLMLVIFILGLFLELSLALWVTLGMIVSFLGVFMVMAAFHVSINMISLFAFILALGIVVDDAIVVGEAVYHLRNQGRPPLRAAIEGVHEVASPVTFAVLTSVIAFVPLLTVTGVKIGRAHV